MLLMQYNLTQKTITQEIISFYFSISKFSCLQIKKYLIPIL